MKINFVISSKGDVNIFYKGKAVCVKHDDLRAKELRTELVKNEADRDYELIESLLSKKKTVEHKFRAGNVKIIGDDVFYKEEKLRGAIVKKILEFVEQGKNPTFLLKFIDKLKENPNPNSVEQLYDFILNCNFEINEDGFMIGFKSVRNNYKDWHSGTYDNSVGQSPTMNRDDVCSDKSVGCSYGLHVSNYEYAFEFNNKDGRRLMKVLVNPKNVVSVPQDCSHQKIRCWTYDVIEELSGDYAP
jgi:hypothetical protein